MSDVINILEPVLGTGGVRPCVLCKRKTSWTVNDKPLCPPCHVEKGLIGKLLPNCDVCGDISEWRTHGSIKKKTAKCLCWKHRDAWFHWSRDHDNLFEHIRHLHDGKHKEEWSEGWQRIFDCFIAEMKGEITVCPYCGQAIKK